MKFPNKKLAKKTEQSKEYYLTILESIEANKSQNLRIGMKVTKRMLESFRRGLNSQIIM